MKSASGLFWSYGGFDRPDHLFLANQGGLESLDCDIVTDGLLIRPGALDYVVCANVIQKLPLHDIHVALCELHRAIKPGGKLTICAPDFQKSMEALAAGTSDYFWVNSWQDPIGNFVAQILNHGETRTPIAESFLAESLGNVGFVEVQEARPESLSFVGDLTKRDGIGPDIFVLECCAWRGVMADETTDLRAQQIYLSWSGDPRRAITVTWQTATEGNSAWLEIREGGARSWRRVSAKTFKSAGAGFLNRASADRLAPDQLYEYRVSNSEGCPQAFSANLRVTTAPDHGGDIKFGFFCDTGINGREDGNADGVDQIISSLLADEPTFVLGGGDYAYSDKDLRFPTTDAAIDAWFLQMEPLISRVPLMAQYGNHETDLRERFRDWALRFAHPPGTQDGKCYGFDVGTTHFSALYCPEGRLAASHFAWLDEDLTEARLRNADWLIVFQHAPIFAHGKSHPSALETVEMRQMLMPLLEKHEVDLHLSGHDQNFERTFPIRGVNRQQITNSALDSYKKGEGVIYAKVSPSGKKSDKGGDFSQLLEEKPDFIARRDATQHHYALVRISPTGVLRMETFGMAGVGTPKSLIDSFEISTS
jgi:hypothetical protein